MWVPNHLLTWMILQVQTFQWAFCFMHFYLNPQNVRCVKFVPPSKLIRKQIWRTLKFDTSIGCQCRTSPGVAKLKVASWLHELANLDFELQFFSSQLHIKRRVFFSVFMTLLKTQVPTGCKRFFPDNYVQLRFFSEKHTANKSINKLIEA